jgi:hypothetical protein
MAMRVYPFPYSKEELGVETCLNPKSFENYLVWEVRLDAKDEYEAVRAALKRIEKEAV